MKEKGERDNGEKKRKRHQGTCKKDPWTKPIEGRIESGVEKTGGRKMETTVLEQQ